MNKALPVHLHYISINAYAMSQYPQLDAAFLKLRGEGVSDEKIKEGALSQGWSLEEIDAALVSLTPTVIGMEEVSETVPLAPKNVQTEESQFVERASKPLPKKRGGVLKVLLIVFALLVVLAFCGAGVYAYMIGFNPLAGAPYAEKTFATQLFEKLQSIRSLESSVKVSAYTAPRETGALPFELDTESREVFLEKYDRDYERVNTIGDLISLLNVEFASSGVYPQNLNVLVTSPDQDVVMRMRRIDPDPQTGQMYSYTQTDGGANFELKATFETPNALEAVMRKSFFGEATTPVADASTVTFTKDTSSYIYMSSTPPQSFVESLSELAGMLASDFNVSGELITAGTKPKVEGELGDMMFQIDAQGDLDDLTYRVNAELRLVDGIFYFIVNNLPGPFATIIQKGQWMSWTPGEEFDFIIDPSQIEEVYKENAAAYTAYQNLILSLSDETGLFKFVQQPKLVFVDGRILYEYELQVRKEAILPFYQKLEEEVAKDEQLAELLPFVNDETRVMLEGDSFGKIVDYYADNSSMLVWVKQDGTPVKVSYSLRVIPPDTNSVMDEKQLMLALDYSFRKVNEEIIIEAPDGAKDMSTMFEESSVIGGSLSSAREKGRDAAIQATMNNLRAQAEITGSQLDGSVDYSQTCTDSMTQSLFDSLKEYGGVTPYCYATIDTWVVATTLVSEGYMCVDSTGHREEYKGAMITSGTYCP